MSALPTGRFPDFQTEQISAIRSKDIDWLDFGPYRNDVRARCVLFRQRRLHRSVPRRFRLFSAGAMAILGSDIAPFKAFMPNLPGLVHKCNAPLKRKQYQRSHREIASLMPDQVACPKNSFAKFANSRHQVNALGASQAAALTYARVSRLYRQSQIGAFASKTVAGLTADR